MVAGTQASPSVLRAANASQIEADTGTGLAWQDKRTTRIAASLHGLCSWSSSDACTAMTALLTGNWLLQSKRAMKAFLDRVNASLPIDEPDHVLLKSKDRLFRT